MIDLLPAIIAAAAKSAEPAKDIIGSPFGIDYGKILAQLLAFGIVAFILNRFAFGPLLQVMDARQATIDDGLKFAEQMKARLADAEVQRTATLQAAAEEAAKIAAEARQNARIFEDRQREAAVARAEELVAKAQAAMVAERVQLQQEVRAEASRLVLETTAAILGKHLSDDERSRFNLAAAEELAGRN